MGKLSSGHFFHIYIWTVEEQCIPLIWFHLFGSKAFFYFVLWWHNHEFLQMMGIIVGLSEVLSCVVHCKVGLNRKKRNEKRL